jgi:hypothetical protein
LSHEAEDNQARLPRSPCAAQGFNASANAINYTAIGQATAFLVPYGSESQIKVTIQMCVPACNPLL